MFLPNIIVSLARTSVFEVRGFWTSTFAACGYYIGDEKCVDEEPQT
jgi:hypothetical protein